MQSVLGWAIGGHTTALVAASAGILTVLGLMIFLRCNAFIAMIIAALIVAIIGGVGGTDPMTDVVTAFGSTAGSIGVVIAMASIIGKCMLESGSAERIVDAAVKVTGEKKAPVGLMASGFILAVPVFFDTVFYLLVPLARSLFNRTKRNYLLYVMAISCGGAITHTLVPPTPGPLLVAATLGVDVGSVMLIGLLVAAPAAAAGLLFSYFVNSRMEIPARPVAGIRVDSPANDEEDSHPTPSRSVPLWLAAAPVVLPVIMITISTVATTLADGEDRAKLAPSDLRDVGALINALRTDLASGNETPGARIVASRKLDQEQREMLQGTEMPTADALAAALNRALLDSKLYDTTAFRNVVIADTLRTKLLGDHLRTKPVDMRRLNRQLLESMYPNLLEPHVWDSPKRMWANRLTGIGNASVALSVAAFLAIGTLAWAKHRSLVALSGDVEEALTSSGLIILITAAGGAFGKMLQSVGISEMIQSMVDIEGSGAMAVMVLGFAIACVLKIAQGSSTVAMIVGSSMVAAIVNIESLPYNAAYLVCAIGGGSLVGSWMNDSGFWVYAKMGGLTEGESLRTWTPLLVVLGISALAFSLLFATVLPFK